MMVVGERSILGTYLLLDLQSPQLYFPSQQSEDVGSYQRCQMTTGCMSPVARDESQNI